MLLIKLNTKIVVNTGQWTGLFIFAVHISAISTYLPNNSRGVSLYEAAEDRSVTVLIMQLARIESRQTHG